jgi:esterase/lipase superfamily enzyme
LPPRKSSPVAFVTDRDDEQTSDIDTRFGSIRQNDWGPSCGSVISAPELGRLSGNPSNDPLVITPRDVPRGLEACADFISGMAKRTGRERVMFFIHGFNNTFLEAVRSGLALSQDLNYDGLIVVWSWPSDGRAVSYPFDTESADWSRSHLSEFVESVVSRLEKLRTDYFAHSMGNRILLHVLKSSAASSKNSSIIFAAPDVAQDIFTDALNGLQPVGTIKELYASDNDYALYLSMLLNSPPGRRIARAGSGGSEILILPAVETVDATKLSSGSGHSYVFQDYRATKDIDQILNLGRKAEERGLERHQKDGATFWAFR